MLNPKAIKLGDTFWSYDWGRAWRGTIALVSPKAVAHQHDDTIRVVPIEKCYATPAEVYEALADQAIQEAMKAHGTALNHRESAAKERAAAATSVR